MYARAHAIGCLIAIVISVIASSFAAMMFVRANVTPDLLWQGYYHDRNGHFTFGQDLALAIRTIDPAWFFTELEKAKVWPPLHGLILAAVLLIGGIDHRLGPLPSLFGWALTVTLTAWIAQCMFRDRMLGLIAAALAMTFAISSPASRLLACDVMLESLGSGLTALCLWAYIRATRGPGEPGTSHPATGWRVLALMLTLLFFEKGNYWGLTVAALALTELVNAPHEWKTRAQDASTWFRNKISPRGCLDPLLLFAALVLTVVLYLYWRGPTSVALFGRPVSLYPPENLFTLAYGVIFVRLLLWWRHYRANFDIALGEAGRSVFYWHVVPVATSFLFPKRLSTFIWFVGPANSHTSVYDPLASLAFYWRAFADGFVAEPWIAFLTAVSFIFGLVQLRRFPPGTRAVFVLVLLSLAGVVLHPQTQGRFLASWIFAVWIGAGVGGALLVERLLPRPARMPAAGLAVAALALMSWREPASAAYTVAIHPASGPSDLEFVRPVLADLDGLRSIAIATTFGDSNLWVWAARERCRCRMPVEMAKIARAASREDVRSQMAARLATSHAEAFVIVDAPSGPYSLSAVGWTYDTMAGILDAAAAQSRYVRVAMHPVPSINMQASVWRIRGSFDAPASGR